MRLSQWFVMVLSLTVMYLSDITWYVSYCSDISVSLGGVMCLSQWFVMVCLRL
jgi:uncharacterized membrane protein YhdT